MWKKARVTKSKTEKKGVKPKRRSYSDETLKSALEATRLGHSTSSVAKTFHIPKSTLISIQKGRRSGNNKSGPATILSKDEENIIITWMKHLSARGFPVTKFLLVTSVASLIEKLKRPNPFKNGVPGRSWYEGFRRRHPEISSRIDQNLTHSRASVTEGELRNWFDEIRRHLGERNLLEIDGSRVFNCDESAFLLAPKGERVLVAKGDRAVDGYIFNEDNKECLTVLFMTNAKGDLPPPMVVFPYERLPASISATFPDDWSIGRTKTGWMTAETFCEYVTNVFEPWLTQNNIERPIVLYVDGHLLHVTLPLVDFCMDHQIEVVALFPNSMNITQPCDKALFAALKSKWRNVVNSWRAKNHRKLKREEFGPLLKTAVDDLDLPRMMSNGFRICGLYPFDADALNYNDLPKKQKDNVGTTAQENNAIDPKICPATKTSDAILEAVESNLDPTLLRAFQEANEQCGSWSGDIEKKGLFEFWQKYVHTRT